MKKYYSKKTVANGYTAIAEANYKAISKAIKFADKAVANAPDDADLEIVRETAFLEYQSYAD